jgi:hypothetical protein
MCTPIFPRWMRAWNMRASKGPIGLQFWAIWWAMDLTQEKSSNVVGGCSKRAH